MQPFDDAERARRIASQQLLAPAEVADAILFAATRPRGVDCVTLRIEPMDQKIV
jgi:NADP-dependent 3-hydroxy acid dehydrogenase YdfG